MVGSIYSILLSELSEETRPLKKQHYMTEKNPKDVSTTVIYTHVSNTGGHGVRSPVDGLSSGLYNLYKP